MVSIGGNPGIKKYPKYFLAFSFHTEMSVCFMSDILKAGLIPSNSPPPRLYCRGYSQGPPPASQYVTVSYLLIFIINKV